MPKRVAKKNKQTKGVQFKGKLVGDSPGVLLRTWGGLGFIRLRPSSTWASCRRLGTREGGDTLHTDLWLSIQSPRLASGNQIGSAFPRELRAVWLFPAFSPLCLPLCSSSLDTGSFSCQAHNCTCAPIPCCHRPFFLISLITSHSFRREEGFCSVTPLLEGLRPSKTDGCLAYF